MKNAVLLFFALFLTFAFKGIENKNPQEGTITITYSFKSIEDGYDHLTKTLVYIDGVFITESKPHKQSVETKISFNIKPGSYKIEIINYAYYDGKWEVHSKENNYSLDCFYEGNIKLKKKLKINIVFDLDNGTFTKIK